MDSPWFGPLSQGIVAHFFVTSHSGSDGYGMDGDALLREEFDSALCIGCQEHAMPLARQNRLRQEQDTLIVSYHKNSVLSVYPGFSLHTKPSFL
jgi:hypothetical protein